MKSAGTISISIALRSIVVSIFGVVLMFMTSPLLSALTLACLPVRPVPCPQLWPESPVCARTRDLSAPSHVCLLIAPICFPSTLLSPAYFCLPTNLCDLNIRFNKRLGY